MSYFGNYRWRGEFPSILGTHREWDQQGATRGYYILRSPEIYEKKNKDFLKDFDLVSVPECRYHTDKQKHSCLIKKMEKNLVNLGGKVFLRLHFMEKELSKLKAYLDACDSKDKSDFPQEYDEAYEYCDWDHAKKVFESLDEIKLFWTKNRRAVDIAKEHFETLMDFESLEESYIKIEAYNKYGF